MQIIKNDLYAEMAYKAYFSSIFNQNCIQKWFGAVLYDLRSLFEL